jgi:ATP-dependent Clp protease protease subunit
VITLNADLAKVLNAIPLPASLQRIREMSNRIPSPEGARYVAKTLSGRTSLYLYEGIGADVFEGGISASAVVKDLDEAQASGSRALDVYVNSPGGLVGDGMAIYSAIRRFKGSKTVYVDGWAASIASVIALAGDRIVTARGGTWMIHEPMGGLLAFGRRDEIRDAYEKTDAALASLHESILDVYESRTKRPRAEIDAWVRAETYMTASEAVERGFSDAIADDDVPAPKIEKRAAAKMTPRAEAELARAKARALSDQFAGASSGAAGMPVTNERPATAGKGK